MGAAVLGAGPAGLTAAYVLGLRGAPGVVYEADGVVGGIAKTVEYNGYRFDLGGHRFFTKLAQVQRLWEEVLGEELLVRPRLSRIYYDGSTSRTRSTREMSCHGSASSRRPVARSRTPAARRRRFATR